ncbi:MAG: YdbH domain-containing protein, partial [Gammaproteobacteria bacterium]|nr:YdbH domain-containing protein [Gammaproteobacteria bacterium]NNJ83914.1 hypothetical protein [Gammaproteobacteria bacterium]
KLSGSLPVLLGPEGIRIRNGRIAAVEPGGQVLYRPDGGGRSLADAAGQMKMLFDVLKDFHYHTLDATANYTPDGELKIDVVFGGRGVEIGAERPVHFNLKIEQNILSLLKSLRVVNGINEHLDNSVRRHFSRIAPDGP